jgi:hypothetical protein
MLPPGTHEVPCGPANGDELRQAVRALELGPLDEESLAGLRAFGDRVHALHGLASAPARVVRRGLGRT